MQVLTEFRHPTRWYSKLIAAVLALSFFVVAAASTVAGYVLYRMVAPAPAGSGIDLTNFPGRPENMVYSVPDEENRDGWFFPGLKSAPTIVLCPGYKTSRGGSLPLAAALQDHGYNVFLFDFRGSGSDRKYSTLGFREVRELRAAMSAVAQREDVDGTRFGLWGTNLGGYVALQVAEDDSRVRALAVESVYDHPQDMAALLVERQGMASLPLLSRFAKQGFLWLHYAERETPPLSTNLSRLAGVRKLFIEASEEPLLAAATRELFQMAPDPKEIEVLADGDYPGLLDQGKRDYENRLVSFFLSNLPLQAPDTPAKH
jgi:pimeloyl-ACP methyl ester carboxylesterase